MNRKRTERQRGAALFVILMLSALLASLVGAAMRSGLSGARAAAAFADAARADELGRAAGDIVSYHLASADAEGLRGGSLTVRLPEAEIDIDYRSESARIDINAAPVALISALLAAAGADPPLIADATQRIRRLRLAAGAKPEADPLASAPAQPDTSSAAAASTPGPTPMSGSTGSTPAATVATPASTASGSTASTDASAAPAPSPAPSGPPALQDPLQVVEAWNLPEPIARRILPALTAASKSATVDPVLADGLVLLALLDGDETRADDYRTRRMQGFADTGSALALLPIPSRAFAGFNDAPAVRAIARVTLARRIARRYEMVVVRGQGAGQAPVVVSWRKLL